MADQGIKKVIISKKNLPAIFGETSEYIVRYRIVSEDKNRTSHWSPQYKLSVAPRTAIAHSISANLVTNTVSVVWGAQEDISQYDIYIKWSGDTWNFVSTVSSTSYSFLIKPGSTSVQVAVQVPTFPKQRFTNSTLFQTAVTSF
jgi:hypothetical protein